MATNYYLPYYNKPNSAAKTRIVRTMQTINPTPPAITKPQDSASGIPRSRRVSAPNDINQKLT